MMTGSHCYRGRDPHSLEVVEVEVEGGCVAATRVVRDAECDRWLVPGLVDLQVNGYGGIDLNSAACSTADVQRLVQLLATIGTTTFLPTVITGSQQDMLARVQTVVEARRQSTAVAHAVAGIHLEGPHISPLDGYRGAHPLGEVRSPSLQEFNDLQAAADGSVRMVTLSPHWPGACSYIHALQQRGVMVALGHTHASRDEIGAAVDAGAQLSTHLGNGIATELNRHSNPLWPQLADTRLTASVIADGVHVPDDMLQVIVRSKGTAGTVLVSDSVALAGSAPGGYTSPIGGSVIVGHDGGIRMRDTGLLAGSGIALKDAVARMAALPGSTLASAVTMATANPARCLQLGRGALHVGAPADLLLFRWQPADATLHVTEVLVQGLSMMATVEQEALYGGETP